MTAEERAIAITKAVDDPQFGQHLTSGLSLDVLNWRAGWNECLLALKRIGREREAAPDTRPLPGYMPPIPEPPTDSDAPH